MIDNPHNPLETALNSLDLQGTLVLMSLLSQKAVWMQQEEAKKNKVSKILTPNVSIIT